MIESYEEQNQKETMLMPLLSTSYDNYIQSSKSLHEGLNWMEGLKICLNPTKNGQFLFCEAIKVDMENSKGTSFSVSI